MENLHAVFGKPHHLSAQGRNCPGCVGSRLQPNHFFVSKFHCFVSSLCFIFFLFKPAVQKLNHQIINQCANRGSDDHAQKTENAAKQQQRKNDPEFVDANIASHDPRTDNIAVHLLQNQNKNQEIQTLQRIHQQNQKCGGNRSQKRTEERNNIGDADNDGNQQGIRHIHQGHAHKADHADDQGIQNLAMDKAAENPVSLLQGISHMLIGFVGEQRFSHLLGLPFHQLLIPQDIDRNDNTHDKVDNKPDHVHHAAGNAAHDIGDILGKVVLHPGLKSGREPADDFIDGVFQLHGSMLHAGNPHLNLLDIAGQGCGKLGDALDQARDDQRKQQDNCP